MFTNIQAVRCILYVLNKDNNLEPDNQSVKMSTVYESDSRQHTC